MRLWAEHSTGRRARWLSAPQDRARYNTVTLCNTLQHKTGPGISRPQPPSSTTKHSSQNTVQAECGTQYSTKPYLQETIQRHRKTQEQPRVELIVHCATCENTMSRLRIVLDSNAHSKNRVRLVVAPCVPQVLPPARTQGRESTTPILIILLGVEKMVFYTLGIRKALKIEAKHF